MQNIIALDKLQDSEVAKLLRFIRREEDSEHIAQLCAEISSEFARIARHVSRVGLSLSDEWKNANHMVLTVREHKTRLAAIHIRATGDDDHQGVNVSQTILRRRESAPVSFSLPRQFEASKDHVLTQLFDILPKDRLVALKTSAEIIPLFEALTVAAPMPHDEGDIKRLAVAQAEAEGLGKMILSPYADDNVRIRSFSRR